MFLERASGFYSIEPSDIWWIRKPVETGFYGRKPGGRGFEKHSPLGEDSKFPSGPFPIVTGRKSNAGESECQRRRKSSYYLGFNEKMG